MENNVIKAQKELYKTHLEFLGYSIELHPYDEDLITAKSQDKQWVFIILKKGISILQGWSISDYAKNHRLELLEFVNKVNHGLTVQCSISDAGKFHCKMAAFCSYEKSTFGYLFDFFNADVARIGKVLNADKIFYD